MLNRWLIEANLHDLHDLHDLHGGDMIGLVVQTGCRYASSITFPEKVEIGLSVSRIGNSSVTYRFGAFVEHASMASAEGHFTHVYVARATKRPTPLSMGWKRQLAALRA